MADTLYDVTSGFYDSINQDRLYTADQMNMPYKRLISEGVFATPAGTASTDFQVLAVSGRNVKVCAGNAILGGKWVESTADQPITIEGNSSGNPRIDAIVLRVDRNNAERKASIIYRTGTAAASPTAPALNTGSNIYELRLADILVASGTSTISQSAITDQRGSAECPWITSLIYQVDTSTLFEQYKSAWTDFIATLDRQDASGVESRTGSATTVAGVTSYSMKTAFGITDFDPTGDIIMLYINGLYAIEGDKWDLVPQTDPTNPNITLQNETAAGQHLYMVVLKPVAPVPSSGGGLTEEIKVALLNCFEKVAWSVENGQDYVDALEEALYPPANLVRISAVYTQSGTVYETDTLDDLRSDLVVTAHYDDSSSEVVTTYTLSGTLTVGTSTITVAYGGKTTTFGVTVSEAPKYTITNNLTNITTDNDTASVPQTGVSYTATLTPDAGYMVGTITITMGGTDVTSLYYADKVISIGAVTGDVVITAVGVLEPEEGLVYENADTIVLDGATAIDTEFAPGNNAFTIMVKYDSFTSAAGATLFSVRGGSTNNPAVSMRYATNGSGKLEMVSNNYGTAPTNPVGNAYVVTKAAGSSSTVKPKWYYKNSSGELVTVTAGNNGHAIESNVFIGGLVTANDGSSFSNYATATISKFKCYNLVASENKIKGFLGVE